MISRPFVRSVRRGFNRLSQALQLLRFDLLGGKRDGLAALSPGIAFSTDVEVTLGNRAFLGRNGVFQGTGRVHVGARTYVGNYFDINCRSRIVIGEKCMLGNFVTVVDNDHGMLPGVDMGDQPLRCAPIMISRNCWLGEKSTVLSGVTIGEGAVVAAGCVVTKDVPAGAIVAGIPAKVIRMREGAIAL